MELALWKALGGLGAADLVKGVGIERLVGHDVILEQRFEILCAVLAEEKAIDLIPKLCKGKISRREKRAPHMIRCIIEKR